jgi:hypothetical protein
MDIQCNHKKRIILHTYIYIKITKPYLDREKEWNE